ncbi:ribose import ATP-binding protein RbsA [Pseudonocardia sulfidoxydans NBRC 16205]|uniref:Ribose import ATP-binding protein RbsA n=1 Tax=Pseudonocardia sulfidoxydans NBRC 16205 TaxID=1223511 RepID=A0A511DG39_9PSEU|nr:sugar ABC transporter ATP-binding protein [Pseudonocardia sulfidoxydans]GEL23751.1 ribose import ATP-binding protein RbsA [Pseudonocardia sulfidoxydans NBRC 16205]
MSTGGAHTEELLVASGWSKTFGPRRVLSDVALTIERGEIHGLVGQNGSGKSTFIKVLSGFHNPDDGARLQVRGADVDLPLHPGRPHELGIAFVHQDLGLIESATVLENMRVGQFETGPLWNVSWAQERTKVRTLLAGFGLDVSPDALVSTLSQAERALLAIARALDQVDHVENAILVLDEPTPHLSREAAEVLLTRVREIAAKGAGVLLVTHSLSEILSLTDRVTVLRDGALVDTAVTAQLTEDKLIELIVGFSLDNLYPDKAESAGDVLMQARGLEGKGAAPFSMDLRRGEIVGLTGLLGSGWERIPYLLFGATPCAGGELTVKDQHFDARTLTPGAAIRSGLALIPSNRPVDGAVASASVIENLTLTTLRKYFTKGFLRKKHQLGEVREQLDVFDVRPRDPQAGMGTLSGGNQQKVLLAKWFRTEPDILLLHEPTQGVDIGARTQIFEHIRAAAVDGTSIVIASGEHEDLAALCDRVLVFCDGVVTAEIAGAELTAGRLSEQSLRTHRTAAAS